MKNDNRRKNSVAVELTRMNIKEFRNYVLRTLQVSNLARCSELLSIIETNSILRGKFFNAFQKRSYREFGIERLSFSNRVSNNDVLFNTIKIIDICSVPLNLFISLREDYERFFCLSEYTSAYAVLDTIEEKIGISIWSQGQKLMLSSLMGTESFKQYWNTIANEYSGRNTIMFLLDHLKILSDKDVSYSKYIIELEKHLRNADNEVKLYMNGKLRIDQLIDDSNMSIIFQIDSQLSIVDLFLSYEEYLLSNGESFFSSDDNRNVLNLIPSSQINSSIIRNIKSIYGKTCDEGNALSAITSYPIYEFYTQGEYEDAARAAEGYLLTVPQDFQIACIYCKSLIYLNESTIKKNLPIYVGDMYSIYAMDNKMDEAIIHLQKQMRIYHGIGIGLKIRAFLGRKNIITIDSRIRYASFLLDEVISPNYVNRVNPNRCEFIASKLTDKCYDTVRTLVGIRHGNYSECCHSADSVRNLSTEIQCLLHNGDLELIDIKLAELGRLIESNRKYLVERYVRLCLTYYKIANKYLAAVCLLVDIYFKNKRMFARVFSKSLFELNHRAKDRNVIKNINHIILTYLIDPTDVNKQIIVYNNLLDSNGINTIKDCVEKAISNEKWYFFLKVICKPALLGLDDREYSQGISPEKARLGILRNLESQCGDKSCREEIFELEKIESIQGMLETIKSGKIFADIDKIYEINKDDWIEVFKSFVGVSKSIEDYYGVDYMHQGVVYFIGDTLKDGKLIYRNLTREERMHQLLSELVTSIANELLFNPQYGLETYLSARIRHGYCKGQLLSFLQNNYLIAIYDNKSNTYTINQYWGCLYESEKEYEFIQTLIVNLTKNVNNKIDEVLNSWLRIKTTENEHGLFDFESIYSDEVIATYLEIMEKHADYHRLYDFQRLYNDVVNTFWDLTESSLISLRDKVDSDLLQFYDQELDRIIACLHSSQLSDTTTNAYRDLTNKCIKAKTDAIVALQQFKEALVHENARYQDFTLNDLSQCVKQTMSSRYDIRGMKWDTQADDSFQIKGAYFLPFVDIVCILTDNAIVHSEITKPELLKIKVKMDVVKSESINPEAIIDNPELGQREKYIVISVTNNLSSSADPGNVETGLQTVFDRISAEKESREIIQKEGGSGLYKLCNIIEYQIDWLYFTEYSVSNHEVSIQCVICADGLIRERT